MFDLVVKIIFADMKNIKLNKLKNPYTYHFAWSKY